jgi:hypothetical protein
MAPGLLDIAPINARYLCDAGVAQNLRAENGSRFNAVLLAITATHKKPIKKCNIVALTVAILGAVMFFSSHGVILGTNIDFLNIWIAIIGAVVVAIQWVGDYFKQQRLKGFGK